MHFWWLFFIISNNFSFSALQCYLDPESIPTNICGYEEYVQVEEYLETVIYRVLTGRTNSGVNQMDPLYIGGEQGIFPTLMFIGTDDFIHGFSKARISSLIVSEDIKVVAFKLDVPRFELQGTSNFSRYLLYLPSHGYAPITIKFGKTLVKVYAQLIEMDAGEDDCNYLQFGNFSLFGESLSPVTVDVERIYDEDGNDVTYQRNRFMSENWKDMSDFILKPKLDVILERLLNFCNEYLLSYPMTDLIYN